MAVETRANSNGAKPPDQGESSYRLKRLDRVVFEVPIRGTAPLIVNRWSEKAKEMMLAAQQTKARTKKDPKDPVANFEASRYRMADGRDGFPATAFKAAIVHSARLFDGITQVLVKQTVIVIGDGVDQLLPIEYGQVTMREDTPRNASGVADLRYRAQFWPWSALLRVRTIAGQFDHESILSLVDAAGIGGVGEWRPSSPKSATGTFGTFEVVGE
jgi:hypothetical protein